MALVVRAAWLSAGPGAARPLPSLQLRVFSWLVALATLFQLGSGGTWLEQFPLQALMALTAAAILVRGGGAGLLLVLSLLSLVVRLGDLPVSSNHLMLSLFMHATIVVAFAEWAAKRRTLTGVPDGEWFTYGAAPVLRLLLLALYFFAVFHKLNRDYFNPELSCAVLPFSLLREHTGIRPFPPALRHVPIAGSLLIETLIPVLLVGRATRWSGVVLAVAFHYVLGAARFFAFSATLLPFLSLFVMPRDDRPVWQRFSLAGFRPGIRDAAAASALAATALLAGLLLGRPLFRLLWVVVGLLVLIAVWWLTRSASFGRGDRHRAPATLVVVLAAFVANGFAPYVGLHTKGSFAMYSNLRTEGGAGNHLIMGGVPPLFPYQDTIELRDALPRDHRFYRMRGGVYLRGAFLAEAQQRGLCGSVQVYRNGRNTDFPVPCQPRSRMEAFIESKVLQFREFPGRGTNTCRR